MGWAVFLGACAVTILAGWWLFTRTRGDRFLLVVGLVLLPPTIWAAGLGLKIGPCDSTACVTHTQRNLLVIAVAALVMLVLALVALATARVIPGAVLMILAGVLDIVATWKVDRVVTIMFAILAAAAVTYFVASLLPNRAQPGLPAA
jgi:hypothetical protein